MSHIVKLSKKNQGTIPVDLLRKIGLEPNQENTLIIFQNLTGDFIIATPTQMLKRLAGSLSSKLSRQTKSTLANMSAEEILEAEKNAIGDYFKAKHNHIL